MLLRFVTTFLLVSILGTAANSSSFFSLDSSMAKVSSESAPENYQGKYQGKYSVTPNPIDDCHDHECPIEENCSDDFCSCHTTVFLNLIEKLTEAGPTTSFSPSPEWTFEINYRPPFLDPALKPPLFS